MKDLKPLIERNQTNGLSQAEKVRDQIYNFFEQAAIEQQIEILLLKSPPFTAPPWIRIECWIRHPQDSSLTLRSSAEFSIRHFEFHRFPIEIDITVTNDKLRRNWRSVTTFKARDAKNVLELLLYKRKSYKFNFCRCRTSSFQFWRPLNKPERFGHDPMNIATSILLWVGFLTLGFGFGAILLLGGSIMAYSNSRRHRHVLSAGKPIQEPRNLIRLDSWQTLVRGMGSEHNLVISAIEHQLAGITEDGFNMTKESIWYWGVDGKEERVQLVVLFRRAIAFIHIYSYGDDLYVGWDAHVNCGTWVEQVGGEGYDKKTSERCAVYTITAGWHVPTEYDITDANCLLERVHAAITKVVRLKLVEHQIDQEIDFHILREDRQNVAGREKPGVGLESSGFRSMLSKFRRVG
jgi:hypothetical protein